MSNSTENVYERLWKLYIMIGKMIMDGVRDPEKVADVFQSIVNETKVYLQLLFQDVEVGATDGTLTFKGSGVFPGGVYGVALPKNVKPTPVTKATVWEQILDGIISKIFGSFGEIRCLWTESQVVEFYRKHRDKLQTETDGCGTFFEIEGGFVARVGVNDGGQLRVEVFRFSYDGVWYARGRHRFVSLKK